MFSVYYASWYMFLGQLDTYPSHIIWTGILCDLFELLGCSQPCTQNLYGYKPTIIITLLVPTNPKGMSKDLHTFYNDPRSAPTFHQQADDQPLWAIMMQSIYYGFIIKALCSLSEIIHCVNSLWWPTRVRLSLYRLSAWTINKPCLPEKRQA